MADDSPITVALFWSKVRSPENRADCWEWGATQTEKGYGRAWVGGRWVLAHRFAYELINGPAPEGLVVRHRCHNRLCCNPDHLVIGTAKDNAQDAIDAGRFTRGTVNGNSKLTEEAIVAIRRNADKMTTRELAMRYGVSIGTISSVRTGKIWRHVAA
jgi:hypothetical protein